MSRIEMRPLCCEVDVAVQVNDSTFLAILQRALRAESLTGYGEADSLVLA
jgi:hypothetical protein